MTVDYGKIYEEAYDTHPATALEHVCNTIYAEIQQLNNDITERYRQGKSHVTKDMLSAYFSPNVIDHILNEETHVRKQPANKQRQGKRSALVHLVSVARIIQQLGAPEDTQILGIYHDTGEDSPDNIFAVDKALNNNNLHKWYGIPEHLVEDVKVMTNTYGMFAKELRGALAERHKERYSSKTTEQDILEILQLLKNRPWTTPIMRKSQEHLSIITKLLLQEKNRPTNKNYLDKLKDQIESLQPVNVVEILNGVTPTYPYYNADRILYNEQSSVATLNRIETVKEADGNNNLTDMEHTRENYKVKRPLKMDLITDVSLLFYEKLDGTAKFLTQANIETTHNRINQEPYLNYNNIESHKHDRYNKSIDELKQKFDKKIGRTNKYKEEKAWKFLKTLSGDVS